MAYNTCNVRVSRVRVIKDEFADEFERFVKPIDKQIWKLNLHNHNLKEVRDILLPILMNRTIEV